MFKPSSILTQLLLFQNALGVKNVTEALAGRLPERSEEQVVISNTLLEALKSQISPYCCT